MSEEQSQRRPRTRHGLWGSKIVLCAGVLTVIGLAMWIYAAVTAPKAAAPPAGSGVDSSLVSGFGADTKEAAAAAKESASRFIDKASPALFRFGLSFIVGCVIAYFFKKFIKWSVILAGLAIAGVIALHKTGVIHLDTDAIKDHVHQSLAWAKGEAGHAKDFVLGYLPSSASACAGLIFGAWKA